MKIGLDIGGTKIAAGLFDADGALRDERIVPVVSDYATFLKKCCDLVFALDAEAGCPCSVGVGIAGWIDPRTGRVDAANLPFLKGRSFRDDLQAILKRDVPLANDANCMTLAEAIDGAGKGYETVFGLILGTGVGAGLAYQGRLLEGANGFAGEIGHLPLPFREPQDGPSHACACGQKDCIESLASGSALLRLARAMTGRKIEAQALAVLAEEKDPEILRVLDRYFEVVAKASSMILRAYDPDIIVVSGGVSAVEGLGEAVMARLRKYVPFTDSRTQCVPALFGPRSGLRGAALLKGAWEGRKADRPFQRPCCESLTRA